MSYVRRHSWQSWTSAIFALILAVIFCVAGVYKLADPFAFAGVMIQYQVPGWLAMPGGIAVGIADLFAGVLLLVPRFRRWGGWLAGFLLLVYMVYIGANYKVLAGAECSCFPMVKRAVGPMFFVVDFLWMAMALLAAAWARRPESFRPAALILAVICVFAGVSYAIEKTRQSGIEAPESVIVDGKPFPLRFGKIFLYFFDPECMHCFDAARRMASYTWNGVQVLVAPTRVPQFAAQFLKDTRLKAPLTQDVEPLRARFKFTDPPYAVLLENGRMKQAFIEFTDKEPAAALRRAKLILD
jgi:uncharacterized membrane protein YphA (DoxX/SURF4 family)